MDFYQIKERSIKKGHREVYPDWQVVKTNDLMVRGKAFYAIWDEENGLWSTDEYDVARIVDKDLKRYVSELKSEDTIHLKTLGNFSSNSWTAFKKYMSGISDNYKLLDTTITFSNTEVKKKDYVSKRLNYPLEAGDYSAYDELISTLYEPDERAKIEWAIGAIISGDAKKIQKFLVFFGEAGTGKSTILNIIQKLFEGYYTTFEAKALTSNNNSFATEVFRSNPLLAIQHDGDLSRIEDNTKLNSIVSHEEMTMNEKYKSSYTSKINCFIMMATNKPVRITDGKSGIIRRLIDVRPSGNKLPPKRYQALMEQIDFELGAIAQHCLDVYLKMGKNYYNGYKPIDMMLKTDVFYNFVEENYYIFKQDDGVSLKQAYEMYKQYCNEALVEFKLPMYKFREELKNYFKSFEDVARIDGKQVRSYYSGFLINKFQKTMKPVLEEKELPLNFDCTESIFDKEFADCPAQLATKYETPKMAWDEVQTKLKDIDTKKIHYVRLPENHIVIDFDLKDETGEKSLELNMEAASKWPPTYAELSKGGAGIHLHYIYTGDPEKLSALYSEGIEVKVFKGKSSLRRRLSKCNNVPIASISSGLPLKGGKSVVNFEAVKNEKALRTIIKKSLNKEYEPHATKPSVDFIYKVLNDAYDSGLHYDVSDMKPTIISFAASSSHHADYCLKLVADMQFKSEEPSEAVAFKEDDITFFDVEVFPNFFGIVYKRMGKPCVRMENPDSNDIERLLMYPLVGFNNRRYDNHILYARLVGYNNEQLYRLSQKLIAGQRNAFFGEAYNLSYTDIYDFASAGNKKSLKKFEIELGIHHQECPYKWDEPVAEEHWHEVMEYCENDVIATEEVFHHLESDWKARQILAKISGLTVNDTTNAHSTKIMFGNDKHPQEEFIYTDLSTIFPGYTFDAGKSEYRGEDPGEGGYVYAEPGMYTDVALLDVASMHPSSIEALNLFGPYTQRFSEIKQARIYIKHGDYENAAKMMNGDLAEFVGPDMDAKGLSNALKTVINSVYGLTSAKFENKFRDPRNVDNIVAKRGALFMIDLKHEVQKRGYTVAHIKTDSIKIPNADKEIIDFVMEFGKKYGYTFEHEATYERMCLVNNAVYIAKENGKWSATGAQFAQPYVFKTLFSHEPITFEDMCETKSVTSSLYLDMNEDLGEDKHNYIFVGKVGSFCPIKPGCGGGLLMREKDGKYSAATGTKGFRWMESEMVQELKKENDIDISYHRNLVDDAVKEMSKYGDVEWFIAE